MESRNALASQVVDRCSKIAPGVHCLEAGKGITRSNVYFVQSGLSWVLIDAASPDFGRMIQETAATLFGTQAWPAAILLTHDHHDHAGLARVLARTWFCPVCEHPDELPLATAANLSTIAQYANPLDHWMLPPYCTLCRKGGLNQ